MYKNKMYMYIQSKNLVAGLTCINSLILRAQLFQPEHFQGIFKENLNILLSKHCVATFTETLEC